MPQAPPPPAAGRYRLLLRDLMLNCSIGAYDVERRAPQRVRVNVELWVDRPPGPPADRLAQVLDYDVIAGGIRALPGRGHINLLETLAERILALCLAQPLVAGARVLLEKPDIYVDAAGVGVAMEAWREGEAPPAPFRG